MRAAPRTLAGLLLASSLLAWSTGLLVQKGGRRILDALEGQRQEIAAVSGRVRDEVNRLRDERTLAWLNADWRVVDPWWDRALVQCNLDAVPVADHPALPDLTLRLEDLLYGTAIYGRLDDHSYKPWLSTPTIFELGEYWQHWSAGQAELPKQERARAIATLALARRDERGGQHGFYEKYDWPSVKSPGLFMTMHPAFPDEPTYGLWSELTQIVLSCLLQAGQGPE